MANRDEPFRTVQADYRALATSEFMSDFLADVCFSNTPFVWVKRIFFNRWLLYGVGGMLALGLPVALWGAANDQIAILATGLILTLPFQLWVALLTFVSFVLAVPRFMAVGLSLAALCLGFPSLTVTIAKWAEKHQRSTKELPASEQIPK